MRVHALALLLLVAGSARAQTPPTCDLPKKNQAQLDELLGLVKPYDCCDAALGECLKAKRVCASATRLLGDVCRQIKNGRSSADILKAVARRAESVLGSGAAAPVIALDENARAGAAEAKVTIVVYACTRCPFCRGLVSKLYHAVNSGALAGKAKLYLRPFPLRDHPGSTEGGLALVAAARLGRFWPVLLAIYDHFDAFDAAKLPEWAAAAGLDRAAFEKSFADPATRDALVASKKEGLKNKVSSTPTIFVDGKLYTHDLELEVIVDVVAEVLERK